MNKKPVIYLDHAATSWPKPPEVGEAMMNTLNGSTANPGRGNHGMALQASRILYSTRTSLARLFNITNSNDIIFTPNTTVALNLAIKGYLKPGDHVITTMIEHNSVRRPLEFLRRTQGITIDYVAVNTQGEVDLEAVSKAFKSNTRMLICSHSSNLLGNILPLEDLGRIAHNHGVTFLVDAAQTAGTCPVDVQKMGIDLLAFPGHKGLLGPQGTGGLYIHPELDLEPLLHGGTGSQSEELEQPSVRPDRYEAGTANTVGISGLKAGVEFVLSRGIEDIYQHEWQLSQEIMDGLEDIPGISILGPNRGEPRTGIVSFNINGRDAAEIAFMLDKQFSIAVRAGYHCTPLGHQSAGTTEGGAVRVSVGYSTTSEDVKSFVSAIRFIVI